MKLFVPLIAILIGSCAPGKLVQPPVQKPVPVAPSVRSAAKPVSKASDQNTEAKSHVGVLIREVESAQAETKKSNALLAQYIAEGKADKAQLQALQGSLLSVTRNADNAREHSATLSLLLAEQSAELDKARVYLTDALMKASTADESARNNANYLQAALDHAKEADKRNTKLTEKVAAAEQRASTYGKVLLALSAACALYVAFRIAKIYLAAKASNPLIP